MGPLACIYVQAANMGYLMVIRVISRNTRLSLVDGEQLAGQPAGRAHGLVSIGRILRHDTLHCLHASHRMLVRLCKGRIEQ